MILNHKYNYKGTHMSSTIPTQSQLQQSRAVYENRNSNLEKLKATALANGSTGTAAEYQRMIDENNVKINEFNANINNYASYFKAETEQANYEKSLEGGATGTETNPISATTTSIKTTSVTEVSTDSGGGTYTVYRAKDTPNTTSQSIQAQANALKTQSELYLSDPTTAEGQAALQQGVATGQITQAQVNEIKSLTADQRFDRASEIANQGIALESQAQAAMTRGETSVSYVPSTTTATVSTVNVNSSTTTTPTVTDTTTVTETTSVTVQPVKAASSIDSVDITAASTFEQTNFQNANEALLTDQEPSVARQVASIEQANQSPLGVSEYNKSIAQEYRGIAAAYEQKVTDLQDQRSSLTSDLRSAQESAQAAEAKLADLREFGGTADQIAQASSDLTQAQNNLTAARTQLASTDSEITAAQASVATNNRNAELAENSEGVLVSPPSSIEASQALEPISQEQAAFLEANGEIQSVPLSTIDDYNALTAAEGLDPSVGDGDIQRSSTQLDPNSDAALQRAEGQDPVDLGQVPAGIDFAPNTIYPADASPGPETAKSPSAMKKAADWRVRIHLSGAADYLYKDPKIKDNQNHILYPLIATNGVLFPYIPKVSLSYAANYASIDPTHSNYRLFAYTNSSVSDISVIGEFTAQNVLEANYVRAVMHFFRSATKMFYGEKEPRRGIPPPLLYLSGFGDYNFDNHPMVLNSFSLSYPDDVDYILSGSNVSIIDGSVGPAPAKPKPDMLSSVFSRLTASKITQGGRRPPPVFQTISAGEDTTRIPTKITMTLNFHPIVTRNNISKNFNMNDYASGSLLLGSKQTGGGIW